MMLDLEEGVRDDGCSRSTCIPSFLESPNKFGTQNTASLISKSDHINRGRIPCYTIPHL